MNKEYIEMIENAYDTNLKDADLHVIENLVEDIIKEEIEQTLFIIEHAKDINQFLEA